MSPRRSSPDDMGVTLPPRSVAPRQCHGECGPATVLRANRERAAELRHDLARDVQAESRAADAVRHLGIESIELLEDPILLGARNDQPVVDDVDAHGRSAVAET